MRLNKVPKFKFPAFEMVNKVAADYVNNHIFVKLVLV